MSINVYRQLLFRTYTRGRLKLTNVNSIYLGVHCSRFCTSTNLLNKLQPKQNTGKDIDVSRKSPYEGLTMGEKVKEAGKDVSYGIIIIGGIAITGFMAYVIGRELFSKESSSGVYGQAFKKCQNSNEVVDTFGEPLKVHGERTKRGRARHVSHVEFEKGGVKHMRMQFYLQGPHRTGTVHVEVKKNDRNKYEFVYLIVETDTGYPRKQIVLEDNR